jgi:hypothetical protein
MLSVASPLGSEQVKVPVAMMSPYGGFSLVTCAMTSSGVAAAANAGVAGGAAAAGTAMSGDAAIRTRVPILAMNTGDLHR